MPHHYFIIYKPYQVLSQFSPSEGKATLAGFCKVPPDVYPLGRLDYDSEGLLLLSNDPGLNHRLLHPSFHHEREYWVQVEGILTPEAVTQLALGPVISLDGKPYSTKRCVVAAFNTEPAVPQRVPPIRVRQNIPTSWLRLTLSEGKNRQVRRMTAAVGFPTLRLIRYRIEGIRLDGLQPGDCVALPRAEVFEKLFGRHI
ncbi:pseudouridine synthase [Dinghuibacter silviterrae]|uniref:Pseudouridine synthase n=1 Tax=Dinghuibacter silviterrae TaxID=1539049 RepID=A0A4R8DQ18_9BACT|nr:pseudouridine synthase [Dinghuibacter silviterrae]TDW99988.1 23S rRNA pseudouridine2457 synthase [Dinghuibacter silviterrae]